VAEVRKRLEDRRSAFTCTTHTSHLSLTASLPRHGAFTQVTGSDLHAPTRVRRESGASPPRVRRESDASRKGLNPRRRGCPRSSAARSPAAATSSWTTSASPCTSPS
jgi:hypothetical protein